MKMIWASMIISVALLCGPAMVHAGQASFILDAGSGKVLSAENPDALNHPASLTKMMTLYLTFDAIRRGKIGWDTQIRMSKSAAAKPPTKLGVRPGGTITVREAVYGMIVKSANDAAAAMAEALGGSESQFAVTMTKKARQLGMSRTVFVNASGLPDSRQITTARDMSKLGIALMRDFPRDYRLFSVSSFVFRGRTIRGHNNLMYRYQGMDGIKTGYTNASGFNLVSAVQDGRRRVVGVVLGGKTARARDNKMAVLLDGALGRNAMPAPAPLLAKRKAGKSVEVASAFVEPIPDSDPVAALIDTHNNVAMPLERPAMDATAEEATLPTKAPNGWRIQISAAPSSSAALALLKQAQSEAGDVLKNASPLIEPVGKKTRFYRAVFTGFKNRKAADQACEALQQKSYDCILVPNPA